MQLHKTLKANQSMKKVLIHAGFPKTGSTSIQHFFYNNTFDNYQMVNLWPYVDKKNKRDVDKKNPSTPINFCFYPYDILERWKNVKKIPFGPSFVQDIKNLDKYRDYLKQKLIEDVGRLHDKKKISIISCEGLSCSNEPRVLENLKKFLTTNRYDYKIIFVIKTIPEFLSSYFSQYVEESFVFNSLSTEHMSQVFEFLMRQQQYSIFDQIGIFDDNRLEFLPYNKNMVSDFIRYLNKNYSPIPSTILDNTKNLFINPSLTTERIKILYLYSKLGNPLNLTTKQRIRLLHYLKTYFIVKNDFKPSLSRPFINNFISKNINGITRIQTKLKKELIKYKVMPQKTVIHTVDQLNELRRSSVDFLRHTTKAKNTQNKNIEDLIVSFVKQICTDNV